MRQLEYPKWKDVNMNTKIANATAESFSLGSNYDSAFAKFLDIKQQVADYERTIQYIRRDLAEAERALTIAWEALEAHRRGLVCQEVHES